DRLIGVLDVQSDTVGHFTDEDVRVKTSLADQVAVAVQNAGSFEQTRAAFEQTAILYAGSERINKAKSIEEALQVFIDSTALRQLDQSSLFFFDHPWDDIRPSTMTRVAEWTRDGKPGPVPLGTVYQAEQFPVINLLKPDEPFIINDAAQDTLIDENTRHLLTEVVH